MTTTPDSTGINPLARRRRRARRRQTIAEIRASLNRTTANVALARAELAGVETTPVLAPGGIAKFAPGTARA